MNSHEVGSSPGNEDSDFSLLLWTPKNVFAHFPYLFLEFKGDTNLNRKTTEIHDNLLHIPEIIPGGFFFLEDIFGLPKLQTGIVLFAEKKGCLFTFLHFILKIGDFRQFGFGLDKEVDIGGSFIAQA
jgi:hypothetical protein